ncbi:MAG: hypothetical protein ACREV7_15710 [Steroidobacteraceae bacterium]
MIAMDPELQLKPATARKVFVRQMTLLAILPVAIATSNTFTTVANSARTSIHLPAWKPAVWDFSSAVRCRA